MTNRTTITKGQAVKRLMDMRIVCPNHGIPDCSPLLNGCSLPQHIAEWRGKAIAELLK